MNSHEQFHETMRYGTPDRVPYFEEGIRDEVLEVWRRQGLPLQADLARMFHTDQYEELLPNFDPFPELKKWLEVLRRHGVEG